MPRSKLQKGKKPDYLLKVLHKHNNQRGTIGVAWRQSDGSISIAMNLCAVLTSDPDLVITLFPNDADDFFGKVNTKGRVAVDEADGVDEVSSELDERPPY